MSSGEPSLSLSNRSEPNLSSLSAQNFHLGAKLFLSLCQNFRPDKRTNITSTKELNDNTNTSLLYHTKGTHRPTTQQKHTVPTHNRNPPSHHTTETHCPTTQQNHTPCHHTKGTHCPTTQQEHTVPPHNRNTPHNRKTSDHRTTETHRPAAQQKHTIRLHNRGTQQKRIVPPHNRSTQQKHTFPTHNTKHKHTVRPQHHVLANVRRSQRCRLELSESNKVRFIRL